MGMKDKNWALKAMTCLFFRVSSVSGILKAAVSSEVAANPINYF